MADVNDVYKNPVEASEINVMAVANVLEAARRNEIGQIILASTVWVYEMACETNVAEDTPLLPDRVNHVYTASKLAAELYCHSYHKLYDQQFTILRYGVPYGPRARDGTVIATFVKKALNGEPLTIMGDGSQYRNFIYVEDLAMGNVAALQDIAKNQTYDLEGMRPVTIKEVAETVRRLVGNIDIVYEEARAGDYEGKKVSAEKARRELGWQPRVDLEEGIASYIQWYKQNVMKG
jgi:UDP-glucose 4-epimerase